VEAAVIFAVLTGGLPNRITAVTFSRVTFVPTRSGSFREPALIQYLAVDARIMTESEAFAVALKRVDRLSDISAEHEGEAVRARSAIVVDIGAMPGADRRLADLVSELPQFRAKEIVTGRVALKPTAPAVGRVPGVIGRAELVNQFNARAVPILSEDVHDPARLPGKFIPSFRRYAPDPGDLSRDDVQSRLSAAERLDVRKILDREDALMELDDNEAVAACVMLTMPAADLYAPSRGGKLPWKLRGLAR
jgi:hypothetical protein